MFEFVLVVDNKIEARSTDREVISEKARAFPVFEVLNASPLKQTAARPAGIRFPQKQKPRVAVTVAVPEKNKGGRPRVRGLAQGHLSQ